MAQRRYAARSSQRTGWPAGRMAGMGSTRGLRVVVADNDPGALELVLTDLRLEGHDIVGQLPRRHDGPRAVPAAAARCGGARPPDAAGAPRPRGGPAPGRASPEGAGHRLHELPGPSLIEAVRACGATYLPKGNLRTLRRTVAGLDDRGTRSQLTSRGSPRPYPWMSPLPSTAWTPSAAALASIASSTYAVHRITGWSGWSTSTRWATSRP